MMLFHRKHEINLFFFVVINPIFFNVMFIIFLIHHDIVYYAQKSCL